MVEEEIENDSVKKPRRRFVGGANAVVVAVAVVVIAVVSNAAISQVFWRFDMTDNEIYTLSEVSENAASDLDEPITVRAFISPNMPPPYHQLPRQVEELLMEYEAASDGMLSYEIISPEDDEEIAESASGYGIEQVTIGQETDRERSYRAVYKGVAFVQGDQTEVVPDLRSSGRPELDSFEYEFTRSLLSLKQEKAPKVGVVTGVGGPVNQPQFIELMQVFFEQTYGDLLSVEPLDLGDYDKIPDEFSALVFLNIDGDLGDDSLRIIDEFLHRGGNIGWFQSGGVVDEDAYMEKIEEMQAQGMQGPRPAPVRKPLDSDLIDYFSELGLHFGSDALIDREQALPYGSVQTEHGQVPVNHPAIFPITKMAHDLPFMRYYSTLVFPLPATVTIEHGAVPDGAEAYEVMRTDESAVRLETPPALPVYEELLQPITGEERGSYPIAAALEGKFPGYFGDGQVSDTAQGARILVVGSGDLLSGYPEVGYHGEIGMLGIQFFMSAVEWLAQEHDLAGVRGKVMPALITDVPTKAQQSMQIINIIVVPGFFASIGLLMLLRRRRRKEEFMQLGATNAKTNEGNDK